MWFIIGTKEKTERVPNGRRLECRCSHCGEVSMFYERRAVSTVQLYFLDVADYRSRLVMACGACGTLFGTDEKASQEVTALESFAGAGAKIGSSIVSGARRAFERVSESAHAVLESRPAAPRTVAPEAEATDDPLADEDAALEARFAELETRARVRIGSD
jgi:predicted dienelactone hydrolase